MRVLWSPHRDGLGDILRSRCGRFVIIQGSDHFTLIVLGKAFARDPREDILKLRAEDIAEELHGSKRTT